MFKNFCYLLFILAVSFAVYATDFQPAAQACKKAGGRYFLNGDCVKIVMEPVQVAK